MVHSQSSPRSWQYLYDHAGRWGHAVGLKHDRQHAQPQALSGVQGVLNKIAALRNAWEFGLDSLLLALGVDLLLSDDRMSKIEIRAMGFSLSTTTYERWELFRAVLFKCLDALEELAGPECFEFVGLRYSDRLVRTDLGLEDQEWHELVTPVTGIDEFSGLFQRPDRVVFLGPDGFRDVGGEYETEVVLRTSKVTVDEAVHLVLEQFHSSKGVMSAEEAKRELERLHGFVGPIFRGCISAKTHEALRPVQPDKY